MKLSLSIMTLFLVITVFVSCVNKSTLDIDGSKDAGAPLLIELSLTESKYKTVTVTLTHNGCNRDKYIIFITDDMQSSPQKLCEDYLSENNLLSDQRKKVKTYKNLIPDTAYRVIAVGVDNSRQLYDNPVCLEFITEPRTWEVMLNSAWKISHIGEYPDNSGNSYSVFNVEVDEGMHERYCLAMLKYDYFLSFDNLADILDNVVSHALEGLSDDWWFTSEDFYTTSYTCYYELYHQDWILVAAGVDKDGLATGMYNVSDVISLNINETAPAYSDWLGEWMVESTGEVVCFDINKANESFIVSGFSGIDDYIVVDYDFSYDTISLPNQYLGFQLFGEGDDYGYYSFYIRGLFNENYFFPNQYDYDVATGYKQDNIICLNGSEYAVGDEEGIYSAMGVVGYSYSLDKYLISKYYEFPMILHRYESE